MFNRSFFRRTPARALTVVVAATALVLSGCGQDAPAPATSDPNAPVTLKISAFGDTALIKKQIEEYKRQRPNVTVEVNTVASAEDARTNMLTKLAAGTGLADVEQLEISWVGQLQRYSSKFVPVEADEYGPFVNIQVDPVALEDGKTFAYGLGTGPEAICYRADLLDKVGMTSDPGSVAAMAGTWADYFDAGKKYAAANGPGKWYDSSYFIYNAQVEQLAFPYEQADGAVVANNPEVEKIFKDTLAQADALSAKLSPFSEDWNNGMGTASKYATLPCPSWLLQSIEANSKGVTGWRIADAFPGGGGNVGGSFLAIPTQSKNPEQAAALASWLTSPEQQIAAFKGGSAFPSRTQALDSPDLAGVTNAYFGDAKVGTIFSNRSKAIQTVMYKGPNYIDIDTAAFNAIARVESGKQSIDEAWQQFVTESEAAAR